MKNRGWTGTLLALLAFISGAVHAEPPRSGYAYLTPESRAMQDDDFENPGMVSVEQGAVLFAAAGENGKSCTSCHAGDASGLDPARIARYPVYNDAEQRPLTLRDRIRNCWTGALGNPPLAYTGPQAIALESFVRNLARGQVVNVDFSGPLLSHYEAGKKLYYTRFGQLDMSCNLCHDDHAGQHLRGQLLSQGQTNGFPEYRLAKGNITGLHQRMKQCFVKFRAVPFPAGSDELIDLEVFLAARGNGLKIETPAVRF